MTTTDQQPGAALLEPFLAGARWFGGKGRDFDVSGVRRLDRIEGDDVVTVVLLVEVSYVEGEHATEVEHYQVPLACYPEPEERLEHAYVGPWTDPELGPVHAYDAVHDRDAMAGWLRAFAEQRTGPLAFHRLPGPELDLSTHSTLFSGEQSNSSVMFGEHAVLKLFRRITPGRNPDIEIHDVLTRAGSEHVAGLYGWVEADSPEGPLQLAMLQEFLRTASDGWRLAQVSVRDLYAEGDLRADEVGGDFAGEASRLGSALREVHDLLRDELGTGGVPAPEVAATMSRRLDDAVRVVPALAEHAPHLRGVFEALAGLGKIEVQRVHADLHLGQTVRTVHGWTLVDFEGEPAKPLAERVLPDSPWRDVAGMVRSFDYVPQVVERGIDDAAGAEAHQRGHRAAEWAARNKRHFLAAYAGGELTREQGTLLAAYVADKTVYECVYEARNRPDWLYIPLAAAAREGAP